MQSAADIDYKKFPATVALLTTALFDAKEQGIKYFDFWGIAPEGAPDSHPWKGFTRFKQSFGGAPEQISHRARQQFAPSQRTFSATRFGLHRTHTFGCR